MEKMILPDKKWPYWFRQSWPYVAAALFVPLCWGWFYGNHFSVSLSAPLANPGDLWVVFSLIKSLTQGEWWPFGGIVLKTIGAPFGPVWLSVDYPLLEQFQFLLIKIIGLVTRNPFLNLNVYYIFGFVLEVWAMIYALARFRIRREIGLVLGMLFAFLPYHFFRYGHIFLASYGLVPFAGILIIWMWSAKPLFSLAPIPGNIFKRFDKKTWIGFVIALLIGVWHVYYAFFFCMFIMISGISAAFYRKKIQHLLSAGIICGLVILALGITTLPSVLGRASMGVNRDVAHRFTMEAELYGMKIMNIIVPVVDHRFRPFQKINNKYKSGTTPAEGQGEYIGFFALSGLFVGLAAIILIRHRHSTLNKISILIVTGCLYATIGGFSSLFSLLITPQIRCPNRISPFLAFFGLLIIGFWLQGLKRRIRSKAVYWSIVLIVGILGMADQISPTMVFGTPADFFEEKQYIRAIEAKVDKGAVLQLPYMSFPESIPIYEMTDYSHLRGYVFGEKLMWSYGAMRGRPSAKNIEVLSQDPVDLNKLRAAGFVGIYIDRFGYLGRQCPWEAQLQLMLGVPFESQNKRFAFFKI